MTDLPPNITDCDTCGALPGQECDPGQHPQPVDKAVGCRWCGNQPGPVCDAPGCLARDAADSVDLVPGVDYEPASCPLDGRTDDHTHPASELYEDPPVWADRDDPCPPLPR